MLCNLLKFQPILAICANKKVLSGLVLTYYASKIVYKRGSRNFRIEKYETKRLLNFLEWGRNV